jgi:hypothetical protein
MVKVSCWKLLYGEVGGWGYLECQVGEDSFSTMVKIPYWCGGSVYYINPPVMYISPVYVLGGNPGEYIYAVYCLLL